MKVEYLQDDFATARHNKTKTQHCTVIKGNQIALVNTEIKADNLER